MAKTYFEVLQRASSFLESLEKEGHSILFVFLHRKNWTKTDWLVHMHETISLNEQKQVAADLDALINNYPPQYLLGYAEFYGHQFLVNDCTLIPRPETEELVELCLKENDAAEKRIIDVGTGTGAIALSLKLARPAWHITASDISQGALEVAKQNAKLLAAEITFALGSGLQPVMNQQIDILISNPPYISQAEWELMDESVRTFEPKTALFADENGLAIYQQLANEAMECLKEDGKIYLEIGFAQGESVKKIFSRAFPNKKITVLKDLFGNDRMVKVLPQLANESGDE